MFLNNRIADFLFKFVQIYNAAGQKLIQYYLHKYVFLKKKGNLKLISYLF